MSGMQISPPMRLLLVVTLLLTALSYGVRSWRESAALPPVIEGAVPAHSGIADGGKDDETNSMPMRNPDVLRPIWPTASIDAMASRQAPAVVPSGNAEGSTPAVAPTPALPDPSFRLVGRYADGKRGQIFFAHGEELIAVRVGQSLPDGFVLKAASNDKVTVIRTLDGRLFDMTLEAP